jgi:hypothetical protein
MFHHPINERCLVRRKTSLFTYPARYYGALIARMRDEIMGLPLVPRPRTLGDSVKLISRGTREYPACPGIAI